jgi:outer membrane protein, heavy metal efflux system
MSFVVCSGHRREHAARYLRWVLALVLIDASAAVPSQPAPAAVPATHHARTTPEAGVLSLNQALAEALQNNPEIRAAQKEREAAQQRIAPAGSLDDPMLEAGVLNLPTNNFTFNREDMTMKMLGLSQRIPYPGKRALKREVAQQDAQSVAQAYQETVNRIVRDARVAYYDLALVVQSIQLYGHHKEVFGQLLKIAEGRYTVGQGTQVDLLRAQTELSKTSEDLIKLERDRPMLEAELNRVLGRTGLAPLAPVTDLPVDEIPLSFDKLRDEAWHNRPQLLALESLVKQREQALELARKDKYPDFDVRFAYGQRDNMPDGTRRSDLFSLTVAINLPVWRATKIEPRISEAQAMHEQALDLYQAQRNETAMKLRQQIATAEQSLRVARLYRAEIIPQSRLTADASLSAYQVNRGEFARLLETQMSIYHYEIARVAALTSYHKALAEIDLLTGKSPL